MTIEIQIEKREMILLALSLIILIVIGGVVAHNSNRNPSAFGHSGNSNTIKIGNNQKGLQNAINDGDILSLTESGEFQGEINVVTTPTYIGENRNCIGFINNYYRGCSSNIEVQCRYNKDTGMISGAYTRGCGEGWVKCGYVCTDNS